MANGKIGTTSSDYQFWRNKPSSYAVVTATSTVTTNDALLTGIFVSAAASTPTLKITTTTGTAILETWVPTVGAVVIPQIYSDAGIKVTVGGSVTATLLYK